MENIYIYIYNCRGLHYVYLRNKTQEIIMTVGDTKMLALEKMIVRIKKRILS